MQRRKPPEPEWDKPRLCAETHERCSGMIQEAILEQAVRLYEISRLKIRPCTPIRTGSKPEETAVTDNPQNRPGPNDAPMIRIGDRWVPAHEAWAHMETASAVADHIERFNHNFPELSTQTTREVVPLVRQRLKDISLRMPDKSSARDLSGMARKLLDRLSPEEAIEQLLASSGEELTVRELIALAGEQAYVGALRREAVEYQANQILPEQTAQIWNDMARPAPGGGLWSQQKAEALLDQIPI
jgi:hypothetical protein